jgi:superfamily II RNA helicase
VRDGGIALEGPHYPEPHRWYASGECKDGMLIALKGSKAKWADGEFFPPKLKVFPESVEKGNKSEIKKLQNKIDQLESEMDGLDDSGTDQYADEIHKLEQQIEKLKLKKEDIEKYATEKEKKLLEMFVRGFYSAVDVTLVINTQDATDLQEMLSDFLVDVTNETYPDMNVAKMTIRDARRNEAQLMDDGD